jgi:DNA-binding NarL/FixJ family response regulator
LTGTAAERAGSPPRALIADDHVPTRAGVRMALERDGIEVCAEAATAAEAVEGALRERPDVCLLDVHMPGNGAAAASMISFRLPETIVLMLTVSRDERDLIESLRRGAAGYLLKDIDPAKLPVAVRAALRGEAALPRALAAGLIEQLRQRPHAPGPQIQPRGRPNLTGREWEVLELLCEGTGTAGIAKRLFLSRVTVRRHVSNILRKLDVSSREEAVLLAQTAMASGEQLARYTTGG